MTDLDSLIAGFYAPPNEIDLDALDDSAGDLVRVLLSRFEEKRRTLLPARVDRVTRWYGFAPSGRDARLLLEEMQAWLGPPLAGSVSVVGPLSDEVDEAAKKLAAGEPLLRTDVVADWQREARENVLLARGSLGDCARAVCGHASAGRKSAAGVLRVGLGPGPGICGERD